MAVKIESTVAGHNLDILQQCIFDIHANRSMGPQTVHDSVSEDALQRIEAEESACGKVHDPAFKITEIYFQEKLLCNFWVKNGNY